MELYKTVFLKYIVGYRLSFVFKKELCDPKRFGYLPNLPLRAIPGSQICRFRTRGTHIMI